MVKENFKLLSALILALLVTTCIFLFSSCSSGTSDSNNDDSYELIVGFDKAYPPYGYVDSNGSYAGFDLDLAKEVASRNGWKIKLTPIDWDTKDAQLNSGAITCIWNGFTYEGREDKYAWSDRYMLNQQVIVTKNDQKYNSLEDLAGANVITQTESAAKNVLDGDKLNLAKTFKSLGTIADYNNAFMQLESGQVDAVACDLSIANYQMNAKPGVFKNIGSLSSEHYAVAFKQGEQNLADKVGETLKQINKDGIVKELCEKYADQGLSYDNWLLK